MYQYFSWLSNIPLYRYTTLDLSIHQLRHIWVVSLHMVFPIEEDNTLLW
jgi:hypothetical protein